MGRGGGGGVTHDRFGHACLFNFPKLRQTCLDQLICLPK